MRLEKGRESKICEEARKVKQVLEAELESSLQALFEEANKIGTTDRIRLADIEKLCEAKLEKK
ncbi:hypothetical protein C0995_000425, partial [Termitomyces sp. Mi166